MVESYFKYWGKAQKEISNDGAPQYHLLPYHCLDVAAVATVWWNKCSSLRRLPNITKMSEIQTRAWVQFFISLHDYGKYDIRFQMKAPEVWRSVNPELSKIQQLLSERDIKVYDHGPAGLYWFYNDWKCRFDDDEYFQIENSEWTSWYSWLAAVTGHHGIIPDDTKKESQKFSILLTEKLSFLLKKSRSEWLVCLENLFLKPAGLTFKDTPPDFSLAQEFFAGFCSVADWLGSCNEVGRFTYDDQPTDRIDVWFQNRLPIAEKFLVDSGVVSTVRKPYCGVQAILKNRKVRQIQCLVDNLPVQSSLSIIESATGSGKTEAALAYAWKLLVNDQADSIIFALPTQATANAMLQRLEQVGPIFFKNSTNLILSHGRAKYQQSFIDLKKACRPQTFQDGEEAWVQCGQWLSQSRKRVFLGQIGVCTIDQVLVSVLPLRHKFVRGFGIGRSVLIVDEVHAYDAYMYGLLEAVLEHQKNCGGSAILLSATLPYHQKEQLVKAWGGKLGSHDKNYPLITWCDQNDCKTFDLEDKPEHQPEPFCINLNLQAKDNLLPDDHLYDSMIVAAQGGAQVCLVCNLVDVAQQAYLRLTELAAISNKLGLDQIHLFHSRFVFQDRQRKEDMTLKIFGPNGTRERGHILVATQVVEQSLDLDFDWMITQLCPVDLLFQRLGRLHRHDRVRPLGFEERKCIVLIPEGDGYGLHKLIYGDSRVLWRTQQTLIHAKNKIEFPKVYRDWIESVYQEESWGSEPEAIRKDHEEFEKDICSKKFGARQLANSKMKEFDDTDQHVSILTRDGEMNLTIVPIFQDTKEKNYFLNGICLDSLGEDEKYEFLNLNGVGVPANWNKKGRLPDPDSKIDVIYLKMKNKSNGWFEAAFGDCLYSYHVEQGLRRKMVNGGQK